MDTDLELLWSRCRALMVFHAGVLPTASGLPALPSPGLACGPWSCGEAAALAAASSALTVSAARVLPMPGLPALPRLITAGLERHTAPTEALPLFAEICSACIAAGKLHMPLMVRAAGVLPMPEKPRLGLPCKVFSPSGNTAAPPAALKMPPRYTMLCCFCSAGRTAAALCPAELCCTTSLGATDSAYSGCAKHRSCNSSGSGSGELCVKMALCAAGPPDWESAMEAAAAPACRTGLGSKLAGALPACARH